MELQLYRSTRTSSPSSATSWKPSAGSDLTNDVDLQPRTSDGEVYFELTMRDAWVWDMYRPARFCQDRASTDFQGRQHRRIEKPDLELPDKDGFGTLSPTRTRVKSVVHSPSGYPQFSLTRPAHNPIQPSSVMHPKDAIRSVRASSSLHIICIGAGLTLSCS